MLIDWVALRLKDLNRTWLSQSYLKKHLPGQSFILQTCP